MQSGCYCKPGTLHGISKHCRPEGEDSRRLHSVKATEECCLQHHLTCRQLVFTCKHNFGFANNQLATTVICTQQIGSEQIQKLVAGWLQGKFKHAACSIMAHANARNYALGMEDVSYEGPLRVRLPVKKKKLDDEGSFSFEIPLPNPDRQVLLKRFAGGFKQALSSPLTRQQIQSEIAAYIPDVQSAVKAATGQSLRLTTPQYQSMGAAHTSSMPQTARRQPSTCALQQDESQVAACTGGMRSVQLDMIAPTSSMQSAVKAVAGQPFSPTSQQLSSENAAHAAHMQYVVKAATG